MLPFGLRRSVGAARKHLARASSASAGPQDELVPQFLSPAGFQEILADNGVDFYAGVPDSLLKDFCGYVADTLPPQRHIVTANEGSAVALAAGYHMATGAVPLSTCRTVGWGTW